MQWKTLLQKELLENRRNYKLLWVPLVIILLSIIDPITTYYLPVLIDTIGGLPDGAILEMPTPDAPEVLLMSLGQLSSLGVLVLILISMGTIAGEYKSGVADLILVKPVSAVNYITTKWVSYLILALLSLGLALLASWYYINLLFGTLLFAPLLKTFLFYGLWFILVITFVIFYNSFVKTPGLVAVLSLFSLMMMSLVTSIFGHYLAWSPIHLTGYIHDMLVTQTISTDLIATSVVTILLILTLLIGSVFAFKKKRLII